MGQCDDTNLIPVASGQGIKGDRTEGGQKRGDQRRHPSREHDQQRSTEINDTLSKSLSAQLGAARTWMNEMRADLGLQLLQLSGNFGLVQRWNARIGW